MELCYTIDVLTVTIITVMLLYLWLYGYSYVGKFIYMP